MKALIPVLTIAVALPASAQGGQGMTDAEVTARLVPGGEVQAIVHGDLNGDGLIDTAYIERCVDIVFPVQDDRILYVMLAYHDAKGLGYRLGATERFKLPSNWVSMAITNGVLTVEDGFGGVAALNSTYRYRYDSRADRMRLIGLDVENYQGWQAANYVRVSWNLLTGDVTHETAALKKASDSDYDKPAVTKSRRVTAPLYMEDTPNPEDLLNEEG
jgi:hypothetical protein